MTRKGTVSLSTFWAGEADIHSSGISSTVPPNIFTNASVHIVFSYGTVQIRIAGDADDAADQAGDAVDRCVGRAQRASEVPS